MLSFFGKKGNNIIFIIILICIFSFVLNNEVKSVNYRNYNYNFREEAVSAPQAYVFAREISEKSLNVENIRNPRDFIISSSDELYIVDTGNNRVLHFDKNEKHLGTIDTFLNENGENDSFNQPTGIDISEDGYLYIADRNNSRIVVLDKEYNFVQSIVSPDTSGGGFSENFSFRPIKVAVNRYGNIFVISDGVYDGIMSYNQDGKFQGFVGAPAVHVDSYDYIWLRYIATDQQRVRMKLNLPIEYSNLRADEKGFIFATVAGGGNSEAEIIRRLNLFGEDILFREGFHPPVGDLRFPIDDDSRNRAIFVDILTREHGTYSALDRTTGRIFTYDNRGNLLYVFGGQGQQKGVFQNPVALEMYSDGRLAVLDSRNGVISVFSPTEYKILIHQAIDAYNTGRFQRSTDLWKKVLDINANLDLAYTGLGRAFFRENQFREAMEMFRLGENRAQYSLAYNYYRREVLNNNFTLIFLMFLFMAVILLLLFKTASGRKILNAFKNKEIVNYPENIKTFSREKIIILISRLKYSLYLIFHPADGFWNLRNQKRGSVLSASVMLFMIIFSNIIRLQYTGFIFNTRDLSQINVYREILSIIIPIILWSLILWSLTSLMEGKGTLGEIFTASIYSFSPIVLFFIPATILSNFLRLDEGSFYYLLLLVPLIWSGILLFLSVMITHEYTIAKTSFISALVIVGMGIALFLVLLFVDQTAQVFEFVRTIYTEITFRR